MVGSRFCQTVGLSLSSASSACVQDSRLADSRFTIASRLLPTSLSTSSLSDSPAAATSTPESYLCSAGGSDLSGFDVTGGSRFSLRGDGGGRPEQLTGRGIIDRLPTADGRDRRSLSGGELVAVLSMGGGRRLLLRSETVGVVGRLRSGVVLTLLPSLRPLVDTRSADLAE